MALGVAPAATSTAQNAGAVPGCSLNAQHAHGSFHAKLHASTHKPSQWTKSYDLEDKKREWVVNWPIRVTASHDGTGIEGGHVYYQFLAFGRIQACRTVLKPAVPRLKHGTFRDTVQWPAKSTGLPLTFRVVLTTHYGLKNLDYKVVVQKRKS